LIAEDCEILENQSTCNTKLTWNTFDRIDGANTAVTTSASTYAVSIQTSKFEFVYSIPFGNTNFYLYHNDVEPPLAIDTATASCPNMTGWDSTLWLCKKYSLTYNPNGATGGTAPIDTATYIPKAVVILQGQENLTRTSYIFDGWNTRADGLGTSYQVGNFYVLDANTTLYAKWKSATLPTLTVRVSGGGSVKSVTPEIPESPDNKITCPTDCSEEYTT